MTFSRDAGYGFMSADTITDNYLTVQGDKIIGNRD